MTTARNPLPATSPLSTDRPPRQASIAALGTLLLLLLTTPGAFPAPPQVTDPTADPPIDVVPIFAEQTITLDTLPVAVVYEPPGENGRQRLTLTDSFTTKTSASSIRSRGRTISVGVSFFFVSGSGSETTTATFSSETASWNITVASEAFSTFGPNEFPANGDLIVHYQDARFRVRSVVGYVIDGEETILDEPIVVELTPVGVEDWLLAFPTVRDLRAGTSTAATLSEEERQRLLELDPFLQPAEPAVLDTIAFFVRRDVSIFGGPRPVSFPIDDIEANPERFVRQGTRILWSACSGAVDLSLRTEEGVSQSFSETHKHTSKLTGASSVSLSPVTTLSALAKVSALSLSFSVSDSLEFSYSRNSSTSQAHITAVTATLGGAGISPCPEGTPVQVSEPFLDTLSGTYLFPTTRFQDANVVGSVVAPDGAYLARQVVVFSRENPRSGEINHFLTLTDSAGRYRLQLPAGRYTVSTRDTRGERDSRPVKLEVPDLLQAPLRAAPLTSRRVSEYGN